MVKRFATIFGIFVLFLFYGFSCKKEGASIDEPYKILAKPETGKQMALDPSPFTKAELSILEKFDILNLKLLFELSSGKDIKIENGSFVYSPLSLQYALGMLCNITSDTKAREQILSTFFNESNLETVNLFSQKQVLSLPGKDSTVTVTLANFINVLPEIDIPLLDAQVMADYYLAPVFSGWLDDTGVKIINNWFEDYTEGHIPELLSSPSSFGMDSYNNDLMIFNALYMKSPWRYPMSPDGCSAFFRNDGSKISVQMISNNACWLPYYNNSKYQVVGLPLGKDGKFEMVIALPEQLQKPDEFHFEDLSDALNGYCCNVDKKKVSVRIPEFSVDETTMDLNDFFYLGYYGNDPYIQVHYGEGRTMNAPCWPVQRSSVAVNEKGVEMKNVTEEFEVLFGDYFGESSPETVYFTADHPFYFIIRELEEGLLLSSGYYSGM